MLTKRQLEDVAKCNINSECSKCACDDICVSATIDNLAAQTALTLLDMLKRLEFSNLTFEGPECYFCGGRNEHFADCELGNLLKKMEVEHDATEM